MHPATQKQHAISYSAAAETRVDLSAAWSYPWADLAPYRITPASAVGDDRWEIPEDWCPLNLRQPCNRTIDFTRAVPSTLAAEAADGLKRRVKRLAILGGFQTLRFGSRTMSPPTPSSWVRQTRLLIGAVRHALETFSPETKGSSCPDGPTIFASLSPDEFEALKSAHRAWGHANIGRLNTLYAEGYFDDWPAADVGRGEFKKREGSRASDPFSDSAFTQILRAAVWLNGIHTDLLQVYLQTKDVGRHSNSGMLDGRLLSRRKESVRSWTSSTLHPGAEFPFHVIVPGEKRRPTRYTTWPFDTVYGIKSALLLCQTANAALILASTGMRIGELTSLTPDSLECRAGRYFLTGRSYKDTDALAGQDRQWPFPMAAAVGFEAQLNLWKALGTGDRLWIPFGGDKNFTGVAVLDNALRTFGQRIAVANGAVLAELDGDLSPHRFRYSTARYVALSLTGASQILFDVLGHDDVEVTLGYALQDPDLHEDINKIRREVKAIRIKEVFDQADQNGGSAAGMVRKLKADMLARSGKDELETDDIAEAAIVLGDAELVRPGVLCTAQPLERGACSPVPGVRDVGACTSSCMHHLEQAAHRETRRRKLDYLLEQIEGTDLGVRVFYQGQIVSNLDAFPDLVERYRTDPRLRRALTDCDPQTWCGTSSGVREFLDQVTRVSG